MKLIGMLDSPYVRRVAISLQLLRLDFEHQSLSVFRGFDAFRQINPVVKAPTLICDDGTVLMDSTLMLQYAEALARPRTLLPLQTDALRQELRLVGLALAAAEKAVQIYYERTLRPAGKRHAPWMERVSGQLQAAFGELERDLEQHPRVPDSATIGQAGVTTAVAWQFARQLVGDVVPAAQFPHLAAFSAAAEALPAFKAAPHGDGTYRPGDGMAREG